jgi:uncharacterized sporulation protein YeaH/YhbH (DUF444 family)
MQEIILARFPTSDWNIYCAQASDGDNWSSDSVVCRDLLVNGIMPLVQYYSYIEITDGEPQNLWVEYQNVKAACPHFAAERIRNVTEIYPVFRELFKKRTVGG